MRCLVRRVLFFLLTYAMLCTAVGIFVAEGALHPQRRHLTPAASVQPMTLDQSATLREVSIARGNATLRAWRIRPTKPNGDAVILLHGLGDNRTGMTGYARILLSHGYAVLLPDARAQGASDGGVATYGLLERDDIRSWFEWLQTNQHPHCIFGLGESMGAAQLLQSLQADPGFCAVIAESSFANFQEIAYDRMGQFFHAGPWVGRTILRPVVFAAFSYARWRYGLDLRQVSPEDAVAHAKVPVLLIHGQNDGNIPLRHSRQIHGKNTAAVLWEVPFAGHCGAISTEPQEFESRVTGWFGQHR